LAAAVPAAIRLLAALVVTTDRAGNSRRPGSPEIEIAAIADPTVVIFNPGAGDAISAAKAGLLESPTSSSSTRPHRYGADQTVRDLRG